MQASKRAQRRLRTLGAHLQPTNSAARTLLQQCTTSTTGSSGDTRLLLDKVALITGSGQGIGAAAALLFARHGAHVVVTDLDAAKAEGVAQQIRDLGRRAISVPGDVTAEGYAEALLDRIRDEFGRLDVLVNNAGYTWDGVVHRMKDEQWDAMLKVHCTAPFRILRAATPLMRDAGKAEMAAGQEPSPRYVLNVSSTSGTRGNAGQINYSTAKAGLIGLTKTVAREWGAFGVRCNCIAYGFIQTRLTAAKEGGESITIDGKDVALGIPDSDAFLAAVSGMSALGRVGTPEDAAGAMLLLVSPLAAFITGQVVECTGGATM